MAFVPASGIETKFKEIINYLKHKKLKNENIFIFAEWFKNNFIFIQNYENYNSIFWSVYDRIKKMFY